VNVSFDFQCTRGDTFVNAQSGIKQAVFARFGTSKKRVGNSETRAKNSVTERKHIPLGSHARNVPPSPSGLKNLGGHRKEDARAGSAETKRRARETKPGNQETNPRRGAWQDGR
jgi:hypothetical protein